MNREEGTYRVVLIGIEDDTEEKRESFCRTVSENYGISLPLLKKILDSCPIALKKNLSLNKAEALAKTLRSFGAIVSVEGKKDIPTVFLEFQEMGSHQVALESFDLRRAPQGSWNAIGRIRNISDVTLYNTFVIVQLFNDIGEFLTFEETSLSINPLPPGAASPFKVVFEEDLPVKRASVAFKNASGNSLPAMDKRKKGEGMEIKDEREGTPRSFGLTEPSQKIKDKLQPSVSKVHPIPLEEKREIEEKKEEERIQETLFLFPEETPHEIISETTEETAVLTLEIPEEKEPQIAQEEEPFGEQKPPQAVPFSLPEEEKIEAETISSEPINLPEHREEISPEIRLDSSLFEEASQILEEISGKKMGQRGEESRLFPWKEDFRNSVETYYQEHGDSFTAWFETYQKEEGFIHPLHSILTILVHARFHQMNQPDKALTNTQKVFKLLLQPSLKLGEIPLLEGTPFFSGESWRELFYRAIPKLREVADNILERKKWDAFELERLIQIIPHMSDRNSRYSVRWMNELIPDILEIDLSSTGINVGENLYRVASRLGVVNPNFDYYRGKDSAGDLKIQSFAKIIFPQHPWKIEEPMTWVGMTEEEGGHCFPTQPQCEGCLFETFCPRLYSHFNPSGKGMRGQ